MTDRKSIPTYVIVSPVKDEARFVELTLRSVVSQTIKPLQWVIVDDGSQDATPDVVRKYAAAHPFIRLLQSRSAGARQPGTGVIHAFNRGCECLGHADYDFIVKLDCDLSFAPDYFEKILARFESDDRLGISSGVYEEFQNGSWKPVVLPSYHACGASKVVRRRCFEQIGGFVQAKGWDTVDEIRAWNYGWTTCHFADLRVKHHKPEGSGVGLIRTSVMHGHIYYVTGGDPVFLVFKFLRRLSARPPVINAIALVWGYGSACLKRTSLLVTALEMRRYRKLLRERLWHAAKQPFAIGSNASHR